MPSVSVADEVYSLLKANKPEIGIVQYDHDNVTTFIICIDADERYLTLFEDYILSVGIRFPLDRLSAAINHATTRLYKDAVVTKCKSIKEQIPEAVIIEQVGVIIIPNRWQFTIEKDTFEFTAHNLKNYSDPVKHIPFDMIRLFVSSH